jgi:BMFP domain-containing protein YqiC
MDLAGRDEVEALKAIATAALDRVETLEARLAALEAAQANSTKS